MHSLHVPGKVNPEDTTRAQQRADTVHAQVSFAHLPSGQGTWAWTVSAAAGPRKLQIQTFELCSLFCTKFENLVSQTFQQTFEEFVCKDNLKWVGCANQLRLGQIIFWIAGILNL